VAQHTGSITGHSTPPPSLVGRAREQALLGDHLAESAAGHGRLVLVGGTAGVGKTALVGRLAQQAGGRGVRVLAGHCDDLTMVRPYGPWLEIARAYAADARRASAPEAALPAPPHQLWADEEPAIGGSQLALFEQVADFLAEASAARPLCLVLEDLHWSDQSSVELLRFVGRQLAGLPLLIVATYRDDDLTPAVPLYQRLPDLVRETGAERMAIQPLNRASLTELVSERYALPAVDGARLVEVLEELTQGNPLYVTELLRSFEEDGVLRPGPDGWLLGDLTSVHVPDLLREVIDARLARLSAAARAALQVAAVIGQEVPLDLWGTVCELDDAVLLDICDEAIEARILEEGNTVDRLRFHHALIREALVESLRGPRRRAWHQRIAEAHAAAQPLVPDRVARHFQQANDPRAVDWLIEAGRRAQWAYAWIEAAEHYEAAARWLQDEDARARERGWLFFWSGILRRYGDPNGGLLAMQAALRAAAQVDDPLLTFLARFYAGHLQYSLGDMRRGITETAAACGDADAALRAGAFDAYLPPPLWQVDPSASLDAHRRAARDLAGQPRHPICIPWGTVTIYLAWLGHVAEALEIGQQLAELWPPVPESVPAVGVLHGSTGSAWADLYNGLGVAYALTGMPGEAQQAFTASRSIYQMIDHRMLIGDTYTHELELVLLPYRTDQVDERRYLIERASAVYAQVAGAFATGGNLPLAAVQSWLALVEGRWSDVEAVTPAFAASAPTLSWWRTKLGTVLACLARNRGDTEAAWGYVRELLPQGTATEPGNLRVTYVTMLQELAAGLELDAGNLAGARAWIAAHDRWLAWSGAVPGRAQGRLLWARYHQVAGDPSAAQREAREALELATEPRQPLALLAAQRCLGERQLAAGRFTAAAEHLDEALALATACAVPYERALTLLALAELRAAAGRPDEALALLDEARAICALLDAAPALARAGALARRLGAPRREAQPANLSPREVEVLRLLAAGKSNKEIALALSMSLRTLERHAATIYAKIGAAGRAEAIAFAHQHDLT
jgi:predicted ATPase/DNA-binding CsgD family transcriptional regulator